MGSLSNLYISQSYQSLIHLGTNNALVSGTMTQLQDGLGNSLNVFVDGTNISSSGNIYAANITGSGGSTINTGSLVTTSSFNSYTSSTDARLSSIETTTASLNNSVSLLNTNSASVNSSISNLNTATASFSSSINQLNASSASQQSSINAINAVSNSWVTESETGSFVKNIAATANQLEFFYDLGNGGTNTVTLVSPTGSAIDTGSFATTGSNSFNGDQTITGSVIVNYDTPSSPQLVIDKNTYEVTLRKIQGTQPMLIENAGTSNLQISTTIFDDSYKVLVNNNEFYYDGGTSLNQLQKTQINGKLIVTNTLTASLQEGYAWVGGVGNVSKLVATSSFGTTINTGSFTTTSSFNSYTSSTNNRLNNLETTSASVNISIANINTTTASFNNSVSLLNSFTQSQASINTDVANSASLYNAKWNTLGGQTGSYVTSAITASSLVTASVNLNTITFTKGDASTFNINVNTGSATDISSLNQFTASQLNINSGYNTFTSSQLTINSAIGASTASLNTFSSSVLTQLSTLENVTSSLISKTGSYATTGSNNFIGDQTITGNLTAFSASFTYLQTIYESSSIIYSSGSNQFGDELTDVQTLSGSVKVQGSLTVNGTPVLTSSVDISGLVTTASFNAYTSSNNQRVDSLESNSASVNISISNINSTTASLNSSVSNLNQFTASQTTASIVNSLDNLNTFSASTLTRLTNIESTTASLNTSISNLNTATSSLFTSASLSLVTASFDTGNRNLTFTKGNATTFSVNIPDVSGSSIPTGTVSGSAQIVELGFLQTSSFNSYTSSTNSSITQLNASSASQQISIDALNTNSASVNISISNLNSATSSLFGSASLGLVTASVNLNTITFTKGDTSTFNIVVNTGSAVATDITALNSFTSSQETKNSTLASVTSSLNSATASLFTSASLSLVTGSVNINVLTFTKGDGSTFDLTVAASGSAPAGTVSSSAQIVAYNIFATTGSNNFKGSQNISSSINVGDYLGTDYVFISNNGIQLENAIQTNIDFKAANNFFSAGGNFFLGNTLAGVGSGSITITANNGGNVSVSGSQTNIAGVNFIPFSASLDTRILATEFTNPSVQSISGSLVLTANTFASGSGTMVHLSSSAQNQVNLVFKNKNDSGTTIISGSNNIFSNPSLPSAGYIRYIGGSNNLYLNSNNGINSQITSSAASVSGVRATMNNNIFNSIGTFTINQAVNTGNHEYSQNYISGNGNVTINALSHTGSLNLSHNVLSFGSITINASSASVAQIATGISGSGIVSVNGNLVQGNGSMTITSPRFLLPSNTQSSLGNFVAGGTITVTNISSSAAVTSNNNVINGGLSYTNAGAAGLGLHTSAGSMTNNYGGGTVIASASAVNFNFNTTSGNNLTLTNQAFSGSLGVGAFAVSRNIFFGQSGILLITGSVDGPAGATPGAFTDNAVIGKTNTIFSNQSGAGYHNSFISNVVGGENLIISASNSFTSTIGGGAYFGRYNANDGRRNKTGETVFLVGTGTSTARKTGFLIDSGSNMFVEGTLNVSGSTTMTGSLILSSSNATELFVIGNSEFSGTLSIQSGSSFFANGNKQFNVGAFQSGVTQSGSANVSQSMNFETTDISSGISIASNSRITLANSGTYNIQFSAQLNADTGADTIWIWLKKNGTNVSSTTTKLVLANNEANVAAWNFVVDSAANDYFELAWQNINGHAKLLAEAAAGNYPAIPSIILTVTQVR